MQYTEDSLLQNLSKCLCQHTLFTQKISYVICSRSHINSWTLQSPQKMDPGNVSSPIDPHLKKDGEISAQRVTLCSQFSNLVTHVQLDSNLVPASRHFSHKVQKST